jgi:hypothetical protein
MTSLHGEFDFEHLVCSLLGSSELREFGARDAILGEWADANMFLGEAGRRARRGEDYVYVRRLPTTKPAGLDRKLFHERIHYWQSMSTPILQYGMILRLDRMKTAAHAKHASYKAIAGNYYAREDGRRVDDAWQQFQATFGTFSITEDMIRGGDQIDYPTATALLFTERHAVGSSQILPAYVALMAYEDPESVPTLLPLTAAPLLEGFAYASELLFSGEPIPRLTGDRSEEDERYLGCWEFWCRLHKHRYRNDEELTLGFLAAVDLALNADFFSSARDGEWVYEQRHIAYRFGKIVYRALGVDPLRVDGGSDAAVIEYQHALIRNSGWDPLSESLRKMAVCLAQTILFSSAYEQELTQVIGPIWRGLVERPLDEVARDPGRLEEAWSLIRERNLTGSPPIGRAVLCTMLEACLLRLMQPAWFALPHLHADELGRNLPLPIMVLDGHYYSSHVAPDWPEEFASSLITSAPSSFMEDIVALLAMSPLVRDDVSCGFLDNFVRCQYVRAGAGCPLKGLSPEESGVRTEHGLGSWCHWRYNAEGMQLVGAEAKVEPQPGPQHGQIVNNGTCSICRSADVPVMYRRFGLLARPEPSCPQCIYNFLVEPMRSAGRKDDPEYKVLEQFAKLRKRSFFKR